MNGVQLANSVRGRWPPIRIFVVSGHVEVDPTELPPESKFFRKPFDTDEMIAEIRALAAA
jgi:DNA-binding response OmpR family regulator